MTKIKRTQSSLQSACRPARCPSFLRGAGALCSKLAPGPRASKGNSEVGRGFGGVAPENGVPPEGKLTPGVAQAQGLISSYTFCLIFLGIEAAFSLGWEVGSEGRMDGPGTLGCRASIALVNRLARPRCHRWAGHWAGGSHINPGLVGVSWSPIFGIWVSDGGMGA